MRSRSKRASFSIRLKSSRSTGPSGPATFEFWLSPTGTPVSLVIGVCTGGSAANAGATSRLATPRARIKRIGLPLGDAIWRHNARLFIKVELVAVETLALLPKLGPACADQLLPTNTSGFGA